MYVSFTVRDIQLHVLLTQHLFGSYKKYIFLTFPVRLTLVSDMSSAVLDIRLMFSNIA